jgi:hypothetical protein
MVNINKKENNIMNDVQRFILNRAMQKVANALSEQQIVNTMTNNAKKQWNSMSKEARKAFLAYYNNPSNFSKNAVKAKRIDYKDNRWHI